MSPLLTDRRALLAYLGAWGLLAVVPASILAAPGEGRGLVALAAALPASLLFGVGTLPLYHVCRALPLRPATLGRVLRLQLSLAALWSLVWLALLDLAARVADWAAPGGLAAEAERRSGALLAIGAVLYLGVAGLHYLVASAREARDAARRAVDAALQAREAQLALLRAQVHPHFLFNSLNAVSALTVEDPRLARELCVLLADFLRGSLALGERETVRLSEELRLARTYLDIERIRLGPRLRVDVAVSPAAEEVPVPALLLQPLVENAITHGVATCAEGGTVSLTAQASPGLLEIEIANPFDPDAPPPRGRRGSGGVGLANVTRRLAACYRGASLTTRREPGRFTARLLLPIPAPGDAPWNPAPASRS